MAVKRIIPRKTTHGIPQGYVVGRAAGAGKGPMQLLGLNELQSMGVASAAQAAAGSAVHGFGFSISGRPGAGQGHG